MTETNSPEASPVYIPTIDSLDMDQVMLEVEALQIRRLKAYNISEEVKQARSKTSDETLGMKADKELAAFCKDLEKLDALINKVEERTRKLRILKLQLEAE